MAKSRDIHRRMRSVDNTRKITRTMEMVSTAKLRLAQKRVIAARPYSQKLAEMIARLATPELAEFQPLLRQPTKIEKAAVVLLTSNRGLCGAFNSNLIRMAQGLLRDLKAGGTEVEFHVYGNKGISFFRFRGVEISFTKNDLSDRPQSNDAEEAVADIATRFVAGELDAAYVVHAEFRNMVSTPAATRQILPVSVGEKDGPRPFYILNPSAEEILSRLLPLYVTNSTFSAMLETAAAEQAARRTAMKAATDNAEDFLDNLRRTYNRARQAEITNQIAEIIGGADALEG